ncbi:MAG: hypothetical protein WBG42_08390 [Cryomorphaceae bacterium]
MKKLLAISTLLILIFGCRDKYSETYSANVPIYMSFEEWRALDINLEAPRALSDPGKIYIYQNFLFVVDLGTGVHILDNSNPSAPQNLGFIELLGSTDVAVRNDVLYADSYVDLVSFDISNPAVPEQLCRLENAFDSNDLPILSGYDSSLPIVNLNSASGVIVGWKQEEVSREAEPFVFEGFNSDDAAVSSPGNSIGIGGSMAQFTIVSDYLYVLRPSSITSFDLSGQDCADTGTEVSINWNAETIFPYDNHLFVGTTTGMIIFDLVNPAAPNHVGSIAHMTACDPVVVQGDRAYVTIRSGTTCFGVINQLDVIDVSNYSQPSIIESYDLTNPHGLGIDGETLFICDGNDGLKVFNAENDFSIDENMLAHYQDIEAYDVIPFENVLIMSAREGIYQYDYSDPENIAQLSFLPAN